jgi:hypothetical protein
MRERIKRILAVVGWCLLLIWGILWMYYTGGGRE